MVKEEQYQKGERRCGGGRVVGADEREYKQQNDREEQ